MVLLPIAFAVVIVALLVRVRRERLDPERPPSAATWIGVGLVLGITAFEVAGVILTALTSRPT